MSSTSAMSGPARRGRCRLSVVGEEEPVVAGEAEQGIRPRVAMERRGRRRLRGSRRRRRRGAASLPPSPNSESLPGRRRGCPGRRRRSAGRCRPRQKEVVIILAPSCRPFAARMTSMFNPPSNRSFPAPPRKVVTSRRRSNGRRPPRDAPGDVRACANLDHVVPDEPFLDPLHDRDERRRNAAEPDNAAPCVYPE